ncbi:hypothetical protein LCGC14_1483280 [marine sediment metagenome]|uniref:Four helix bundle protein n=1 Tax=marine sediment metagenome TaxID=412755 RepID=A0A0F9MAP5_9ZZZZ
MEKPHKKLDVWKVSMEIVQQVYKAKSAFLQHEMYVMANQMRIAAVSIRC